jgi:chemotaxis protein histidine kinase CheA
VNQSVFKAPEKAPEAEIIQPPNTLRAKVGARFPGVDAEAIARAEAALASLSSQFEGWLRDETQKLEAAHREVRDAGRTPERMTALYTCAHDLKGLGTTYGYPLISRIMGSLCKLLDAPAARARVPMFLLDAHIDAVRAVVRDQIKDPAHPVGLALCQALETRVAEHAPVDDTGAPIAPTSPAEAGEIRNASLLKTSPACGGGGPPQAVEGAKGLRDREELAARPLRRLRRHLPR